MEFWGGPSSAQGRSVQSPWAIADRRSSSVAGKQRRSRRNQPIHEDGAVWGEQHWLRQWPGKTAITLHAG